MTAAIPPAQCDTKQAIRRELDRIDNALLKLFAERHAYVSRMAELKIDVSEAYDADRIDEILSNVRIKADTQGLAAEQAELIWRTLIEWNINYEQGIIAGRQKS